MSLSTLPLSYCTNVHPGQTVSEVLSGLQQFTIPARRQLNRKIAAGLWLAAAVVDELSAQPAQLQALQQLLEAGDLTCYSLNAFPYGNFHSERVKEQVYIPDWTNPDRLAYTLACAKLLAQLMPVGVEGSLSTVPLGFQGFEHPADFQTRCIDQLLSLAVELDRLHDETGQVVRLAIEPEPCCVLETTAQTLRFFEELFGAAEQRAQLDIARRHLGLCFDVCHQAVEFEDIPQSIQQLNAAEIRINKVHLTCALHLDRPGTSELARSQLAHFVEPRYLHQTFARFDDGRVSHLVDLTQEFCTAPQSPFGDAQAWRVHFHVPVHRESLGELQTTRSELKTAIAAVSRLEYAPHLEVETYTWGVLPEELTPSLVDGLVSELSATFDLIASQRQLDAEGEMRSETPTSA